MNADHTGPDFSGDDFADDPEIQKHRAEIKAYQKMIDDSLSLIGQRLQAEESSHINLKGFQMFKSKAPFINVTMRSASAINELRVVLASYHSSYPTGRLSNSGSYQYVYGYFRLQAKYPPTYIQPETIREKIADLILKLDVDFADNKKFSRKFRVLTSDKDQLQRLLQYKELDQLVLFPEMELELNGDACLFRHSSKAISVEEAARFCDLTVKLYDVLN